MKTITSIRPAIILKVSNQCLLFGIALAERLDTCFPSIEQIEAELGRIGNDG